MARCQTYARVHGEGGSGWGGIGTSFPGQQYWCGARALTGTPYGAGSCLWCPTPPPAFNRCASNALTLTPPPHVAPLPPPPPPHVVHQLDPLLLLLSPHVLHSIFSTHSSVAAYFSFFERYSFFAFFFCPINLLLTCSTRPLIYPSILISKHLAPAPALMS